MNENQTKFLNELKANLQGNVAEIHTHVSKREEIRADRDGGKLAPVYASSRISELDGLIGKMLEQSEAEAMAIIDKRLAFLESETAMDASQLNDDARLLQFDFLSQNDVDQIAKRNSGNPTMSKLIKAYADRHNLECPTPRYLVEIGASKKQCESVRDTVRRYMRHWAADKDKAQAQLERFMALYGV